MAELEFHCPETLEEALERLKRFPETRIIAGGTDLLVLMRDRLVQTKSVISPASSYE